MRAFIIGNGPTMADIDLSRLDDEVTMAFNNITPRLGEFSPTFWVFSDRSFYNNYRDELEKAQKGGVRLITTAYKKFNGASRVIVYGDSMKLKQGIFKFYSKKQKRSPFQAYSVGAIGYTGLQIAWQQGYRKIYVMGFDSRDARPKKHYIDGYRERMNLISASKSGLPADVWGKGYDYANKWIWEHGGEIWDVSHSRCGSFPYKDMDEVLNG